jgi:hypothetical protein
MLIELLAATAIDDILYATLLPESTWALAIETATRSSSAAKNNILFVIVLSPLVKLEQILVGEHSDDGVRVERARLQSVCVAAGGSAARRRRAPLRAA